MVSFSIWTQSPWSH